MNIEQIWIGRHPTPWVKHGASLLQGAASVGLTHMLARRFGLAKTAIAATLVVPIVENSTTSTQATELLMPEGFARGFWAGAAILLVRSMHQTWLHRANYTLLSLSTKMIGCGLPALFIGRGVTML